MWRHVYAIQNHTQTGSDATVTDSLRFGIYVWSSNRSYLVCYDAFDHITERWMLTTSSLGLFLMHC